MAEETKGAAVPEESVIRLLEQQSRYGMDQDTMLIYINSVNLMNILSLLNRRQGGGVNLSMPAPVSAPALPALAPGAAPGSGPSMENLMGMLLKMLGSQGGGSPGQGLNPAMLMNLWNALGGPNMDLGGLMSMLAGLMGAGPKPAPKVEAGNVTQATPAGAVTPPGPVAKENGVGVKTSGEEKVVKREPPRIMKWDQLEDRKKA